MASHTQGLNNKDEYVIKQWIYYRNTDGQNIYRIDAHWLDESSQKIFQLFIWIRNREINFFPKRLRLINGQTGGHKVDSY